MSAEAFIAESALIWRRTDTKADTVAPVGTVDPWRLGENRTVPYPYADGRISATAAQLTRPFEDNNTERARHVPLDQGFALLNRRRSPGYVRSRLELERSLVSAPVYYEVRPLATGTLICYWLFFGSSAPPYHAISAIVERQLATVAHRARAWLRRIESAPWRWLGRTIDIPDAVSLVRHQHAHQGDWEGVTARLSPQGELESVYLRSHDTGHRVPAEEAVKRGRIVIYCALGSHACFAPTSPHNDHGDVLATTGIAWDPVDGPGYLADASSQPWFGFGGAWGDPGLDRRFHVDIQRKRLAGPLGPSRFKRIWPR